jgi:hypothetical protein
MAETIPPSKKALEEALVLSSEILQNIELNELPLSNIALKTSRLARILNDFDVQKMMEFEVGGYPSTPDGISPDVWRLAVAAGRKIEQKGTKEGEIKETVWTESIASLEHKIEIAQVALEAARDPDISLSPVNPTDIFHQPRSNYAERMTIQNNAAEASQRLPGRRALIYGYTLRKHYELKFSSIADDVFSRLRERVDSAIGMQIPIAVKRLAAVYDNLRSENPEDWSNAVHSCRRILQDFADAVFPPREDKIVKEKGKEKRIKLGKENYINRIMAFIENRSSSKRFNDIVGSHLRFIGERLDAVFEASQKGSHDTIISREEADRYVVYTYLIVGDLLSLIE